MRCGKRQDTLGNNYHVGMTTDDNRDTRAVHHVIDDPSCWLGSVCNRMQVQAIMTINTLIKRSPVDKTIIHFEVI